MPSPSGVADLLARLVALDSRNPVLAPGAPGEAAIATAVADFLRAAGLEVAWVAPQPDRPSVVGRLRGTGGGRALLLNGHLDTVGFGGMPDPTTPRTENGRLYGRGAYDMKGGLAAILHAAATLARGPRLRGDLIVTAVSDEEHASLGTEAVLAHLGPEAAGIDGAIVTEPTDLQICVAHKGFAWATFTTQGRAAHGSRRADGIDAIAHMGRILVELERLDAALQQRPAHPLLGHASLHASLIAGGTELSTYPAHCELQVERRTLPGETPASVESEFAAIVDTPRAADPHFHGTATVTFTRPPLETPIDSPVVQALIAAASTLGAAPPLVGATFWMDAALLGAAGIPSVAFGPRGADLHADSEWVDLASVEACAAALIATARAFCA
jgi:acetylornithine deacetylase